MSAIFGLFNRDGSPLQPGSLETMQAASAHWGHHGSRLWQQGCAGLGQSQTHSTPEAPFEHLPRFDSARGLVFTAAARLDNRAELLRQLAAGEEAACLPDGELAWRAYQQWGEDCPQRLLGDWSLAVWDERERRLFVARDHFGNTALYYYLDARVLAFASERKALLALKLAPLQMDELYLGQVLIAWNDDLGERTIHATIRRLPPAHTLFVTPKTTATGLYWRMEDTPLLHLADRREYVEGLRETLEAAVSTRLRAYSATAGQAGRVAVTLSGGLDSGSVTATAAALLRPHGRRIAAYTSAPAFDTRSYIPEQRFGDELPFAQATAQFAGNVDLYTIDAAGVSPVQAIRAGLQVHHEPGHAASNLYWMMALEQTAAAAGNNVLLTGQLGNAGLSWTGDAQRQTRRSPSAWLKENLKRFLPRELITAWRRQRIPTGWEHTTAILPAFAQRLDLGNQRLKDQPLLAPSALEQRYRILKPGQNLIGALHAQMGAANGIEIRDPSTDVRLLTFTLSVPDEVFYDRRTGLDRWLIREAMQGRLPDEVRLNRRRGRQAADFVPRLRAFAADVETALQEIASGPARDYVNANYLRQIWQFVQTHDNPEAHTKASTVLGRGIMAGLWVNQFQEGR